MGIDVIAVLTLVAFVAGFIDAIAGGGGLLTLPALLLAGLPPVAAVATNKLQASAATVSAAVSFARKGLFDWLTALPLALATGLGGVGGALCVSLIPKAVFLTLVPFLLAAVALYALFAPKLDRFDVKPKMSLFVFGFTVAPLIGFYDGVFGPGTGSFLLVALVGLAGLRLVSALSYAKLANMASNLGSLIVFLSQGAVVFSVAVAMAIGAALGAYLGARFAVRFGSVVIKPLLVVISLAMALKLLFDPENPLGAVMTQIGLG